MQNKPVIALTFDDGPNNGTTVEILNILERYGIVATFFVVGDLIGDETRAVVKRAYDRGCEIGNHSKTHAYMDKLKEEEITCEVAFTSEQVAAVTGERPRFFRPPYIAVNDLMFNVIHMPFICGVNAQDWDVSRDAQYRSERVLEQAADGVIILLHDMQGNTQTVEALETIIPALLAQGYVFVTVSQLFEAKGVIPEAGKGICYSVV